MKTAIKLARAFGLSSPALLGSFDHNTFSLRTSQGSLLCQEQWGESLETLPDSGMWDAGNVYELRTSERPTSESGSSSWPSARQEDGESCGNHPGVVDSLTGAVKEFDIWRTPDTPGHGGPRNRQGSIGAGHQVTIAEQAEHWLTPQGMANEDKTGKKGGAGGGEFALQANNWQSPATDSFRSRGGDRKDEMGLDQQARMFPTPASRDYRTPNLQPGSERGMGTKGEQLQNFVEHNWPTENGRIAQRLTDQCLESRAAAFPSPPVPQIPDGPPSSESAPTSRRRFPTPSASMATMQDMEQAVRAGNSPNRPKYADLEKRRLNPRFVEFLMGLPIGWTEL